MSDDPTLPSGGVRLDILDPNLSVIERRGGSGRHTASAAGRLASSSDRLWGYLARRQATRVGAHKNGLIAQDEPDLEVLDPDVAREYELIDPEKVQKLENPEVLLRPIKPRPLDQEVYGRLQDCTPQFFLRNVRRVTNETDMFGSPFKIEVWRNSADYRVEVGRGQGMTWTPPDIKQRLLWEDVQETTAQRKNVINDIDWAEYRGRWKEGITRMSFFEQFGFLFETERTEGRFTSDDQQVQASRARLEEEERRKGAEEIARRDAEQTGAETQLASQAAKDALPDKYKDLPDHILRMIGMID
jgi:hypothetical protein